MINPDGCFVFPITNSCKLGSCKEMNYLQPKSSNVWQEPQDDVMLISSIVNGISRSRTSRRSQPHLAN